MKSPRPSSGPPLLSLEASTGLSNSKEGPPWAASRRPKLMCSKCGAVCSTCACAALAIARSVRAASAPVRLLAGTLSYDRVVPRRCCLPLQGPCWVQVCLQKLQDRDTGQVNSSGGTRQQHSGLTLVWWLSRSLCGARAHADGRTSEARLLAAAEPYEGRESHQIGASPLVFLLARHRRHGTLTPSRASLTRIHSLPHVAWTHP
jgi:hypothetical protein